VQALPTRLTRATQRPRPYQPGPAEAKTMADFGVPHFHNDPGVAVIHIGSKEFMCIGAKPPFDHPHIFIDMGSDTETICSYCGTHYKYSPSLPPGAVEPADCTWSAHEEDA
jgi:uncharacterized Zn-finger protein